MNYLELGFSRDITKQLTPDIGNYINPETVGSIVGDGTFGGSVLVDGAISEDQLGEDSVTSKALSDAAVVTEAIADGAIDTDKLANLAVEAAKLANSAVETAKIANAAVGSAAIAALAVGTAAIANGAILEAKIGNLAVTNAKINDISFTKASGGTLTLGGSANVNGVFSLKNSSDAEVIAMDNTGIRVYLGGDIRLRGAYEGPIYNPGEIVWEDAVGSPTYRTFDTGGVLYIGGIGTASSRSIAIGAEYEHPGFKKSTVRSSSLSGLVGTGLYVGLDTIVNLDNKFTLEKTYSYSHKPIKLNYQGSSFIAVGSGGTGFVTVTHNLGYAEYYVMLSLDQTGGSYMDYVTYSWERLSSTQIRIYYKNNAPGTAVGRIYWQLYKI